MTLSELKAQAARVFVEECAQHEVVRSAGNQYRVRLTFDRDHTVFIAVHPASAWDDCQHFITMRGLEARDRCIAENYHLCSDMLQLRFEEGIIKLGKQEG